MAKLFDINFVLWGKMLYVFNACRIQHRGKYYSSRTECRVDGFTKFMVKNSHSWENPKKVIQCSN